MYVYNDDEWYMYCYNGTTCTCTSLHVLLYFTCMYTMMMNGTYIICVIFTMYMHVHVL